MNVQIVRAEAVAGCPKLSLLAEHYREDGSCRCDEHEQAKRDLAALQVKVAEAKERVRRS